MRSALVVRGVPGSLSSRGAACAKTLREEAGNASHFLKDCHKAPGENG